MDNEQILEENTVDTPEESETEAKAQESLEADELERLRSEVKRLNDELQKSRVESERINAQLTEFSEVFPGTDIGTLPEDVWESVRAGNSLAASYALYTQRLICREQKHRSVNDRNSMASSGRVTGNAPEYFTPSEVRAMSQSEVHANFAKIKESMKKWN